MVPDLLILPPGTDLHDHPLVKNGSVLLQVRIISILNEGYMSLVVIACGTSTPMFGSTVSKGLNMDLGVTL